jgi:hypothetical protein
MFVVEYNGKQVLTGASRDLAGFFLVFVCAACALLSLHLIAKDCRSKRSFIISCQFDIQCLSKFEQD